jgi:hypothetical protein
MIDKFAAPEFTLARVYDFADPVTGPGFAPDHPVITDPARRAALLGYLRGGRPALTTTATSADIVERSAGAVVPVSFRTDGQWIWTDAVAYYLDAYGLAPEAGLTAHIERQLSRGLRVPDADHDQAVSAADFLLRPPPELTRTVGGAATRLDRADSAGANLSK